MSTPRSTSASSWVVAGSLVVAATVACAAMAIYAAARQAADLHLLRAQEEEGGRLIAGRLTEAERRALIASARLAAETRRASLAAAAAAARPATDRLSEDLMNDTGEGRVPTLVLHLPYDVRRPVDALERLVRALARSDRLQRLEIRGVDPELPMHEILLWQIIQWLSTNRGLLHLVMRFDYSRQVSRGLVTWLRTSPHPSGFEPQWTTAPLYSPSSPFYWRRQIFLLNHYLWRLLWEAVSTHPTLRVVDISEYENSFATAYEREFRDLCILRALATNRVLTDLVCTEHDHDYVLMQAQVLPALELNRFRSIVNSVPDRRVRRHLLALAAAHPRAARYSAVRSFVVLALRSELESPEPANEQVLVA